MKQRIMLGFTVAALACTPAFAQHTSASTITASATTNPGTVESCFKTLAGEWYGEVATTNGGKTSCSHINASNRIENDGARFASSFQGFSFGQPFQGASVFSAQDNRFNFAFTDTLNTDAARGTFKTISNGNGFIYSFERADSKTGKNTRFEQITTIVNNDNYTVTCWSFDSNGKKHEVMSMDMNRMLPGQTSEAADYFSSSPTLAKARQTLANSVQATADDTK